MTGIEKCIKAAGGQQKLLAQAEGVTDQAVSLWVQQGWVPSRRAKTLSERYGVPVRELLRPDLRELLK